MQYKYFANYFSRQGHCKKKKSYGFVLYKLLYNSTTGICEHVHTHTCGVDAVICGVEGDGMHPRIMLTEPSTTTPCKCTRLLPVPPTAYFPSNLPFSSSFFSLFFFLIVRVIPLPLTLPCSGPSSLCLVHLECLDPSSSLARAI